MEPVSTMVTPPPTGKVAFQLGLIFGVIQAIIASSVLLVNNFVNTTSSSLGISLLLTLLSFLTGLAAYFVAGILGAQKTGKVKTGTFAGMWTGGIYGIIGFVVSMTIFFQVSYPRLIDAVTASGQYANNMDAYKTGAMIGGVGFAIFGILLAIGLGAGLGALGGLIGRKTSRFKPAPVVQMVYAPYPGQPMPSMPDQPVAYAPGQPMPYAPGQPAAYVPGQPMPYAPGQPVVYPQPVNAEQIYPEQPAPNPYMELPPQQQ